MRKIKLTQGKYALVDNEDYVWLNKLKWSYDGRYAFRVNKGNKFIRMHKMIMNTPKGKVTDHINRNKLDNRRENLRIVSRRVNTINRGIQKNNTSGYKGISWSKTHKRWFTYITINSKMFNLGEYINIKDAIKARREAGGLLA